MAFHARFCLDKSGESSNAFFRCFPEKNQQHIGLPYELYTVGYYLTVCLTVCLTVYLTVCLTVFLSGFLLSSLSSSLSSSL